MEDLEGFSADSVSGRKGFSKVFCWWCVYLQSLGNHMESWHDEIRRSQCLGMGQGLEPSHWLGNRSQMWWASLQQWGGSLKHLPKHPLRNNLMHTQDSRNCTSCFLWPLNKQTLKTKKIDDQHDYPCGINHRGSQPDLLDNLVWKIRQQNPDRMLPSTMIPTPIM